jgi:hypothetical protein
MLIYSKQRRLCNIIYNNNNNQNNYKFQASTKAIVDHYRILLTRQETRVFRSMLRKIANFKKDEKGLGWWTLKPEYL